jgi:hypothetical protein
MSNGVKDVWAGDLALIELAAGRTEAPQAVLQELKRRGHVKIAAGKATLTTAGTRRAQRLHPHEHDLRLQATSNKGSAITTDGASRLHIGSGGTAKIRS